MNCNSFAALASPLVLALALACGGGSGSSTANTIVVTPTVTPASHLNYIGIGQNAQVSTQAQANCTYTWTVSGDAAASITAGQGSNAITITPTSAATANTSLHVSVTVQATAGSSSGTGSIDILEVLPPTPTVQNSTINDYVNPGQALTFTANSPVGVTNVTVALTGTSLYSGQSILKNLTAASGLRKAQSMRVSGAAAARVARSRTAFMAECPPPTTRVVWPA